MQYSLKDIAFGLKIGHQIVADGSEQLVVVKMNDDPGKIVCHLRSRGYTILLRLFPDLVPNPNQEWGYYLEEGMIHWMSKKIGLPLDVEMEAEGNVCFANSSEVRDDFRISFSPMDIVNYCCGVLYSAIHNEKHTDFLNGNPPGLVYPNNSTVFWELVRLGEEANRGRDLYN